MARLFVTQRELDFIADITKEIVSDVSGQRVNYYSISELKSRTHELYQETPEKIFDNPVEVPCLVDQPVNATKTDLFGPERLNTLEVFVQTQDAIDRGINISIGDFISYGDRFYEISQLTTLGNIYGQVENENGLKLTCTQARKGQFASKIFGPTERKYSDRDAVQEEFVQTRGFDQVDDAMTNDKRALIEKGVLEPPLTGAKRVKAKDEDVGGAGQSFYDED